jgi:dihydroxyacetone kinase phosphoprotein-dependent L subunit
MESFTKENMIQLLLFMADEMINEKDNLNTLDAAIGDGDLGITLTLGFHAIRKQLNESQYEDLFSLFSDCGMAFGENAASTFGTLVSTMFTKAGGELKEKKSMGPEEGVAVLQAAIVGVQKRGGATLGDKTILDALIPAKDAFERSANSGQSGVDCLDSALLAAQEGAERTVEMRSKAGRAGWLGDRTVGEKDPGAAAFVLMLKSARDFITELNLRIPD